MKKYFHAVILLVLLSNLSFSEQDMAPDFKLKIFGTDNSVSLSDLCDTKTVIVLSFFDTSCEPCKKEIPKLNVISSRFIKSAKVFMVCLDDKAEDKLNKFVKKNNVKVPILLDPLGYRAGEKYGVIKYGAAEIPQVFVIGKGGKIRAHYKGYHEDIEQKLSKDIRKLSSEKYVVPKIDAVKIIYTSSANGYLESCDCPQNPFGGIARRITAINDLLKKNPGAVVLDSGDTFPPRKDSVLTKYCTKMVRMINYDMVGIGDQEILNGIDYLKTLKDIPFYSANLTTCDDKMCYPFNDKPYITKKVCGANVSIISILNPNIFFLFPKDQLKNVKILNHIEYLKKIIPEIREKSDIVVLLSHCGDEEDRNIIENVPRIDVIVGGHSQTYHKVPVKIKDTIIVQGGQNGHRVGVLELKLDDNKKIESYKNEFILLNKDVKDDPKARLLIEQYKNELKERAEKLVK
ncbi:MAG: redoxin domain-containing protein [Endomicrobiales bacterium]|nr:redoxin domain-containing protein [Endomicrobiales bacterium]